jgi:hypothetical protein
MSKTPTTAFVAFMNDLGNAHADKVNPAFKSRYASLAEILDTVKPVALKHGFCIRQVADSHEGSLRVQTFFQHESGETFPGGILAVKADTLSPQQLGSALTYIRRQGLQTACCISVDLDDDAASSSVVASAGAGYAAAFPSKTSPFPPKPVK